MDRAVWRPQTDGTALEAARMARCFAMRGTSQIKNPWSGGTWQKS
jgi:hypothetical protein